MKKYILSQGAEAVIIREKDFLVKNRISKGYRYPKLDDKIRKQRTRKEAKILVKSFDIISVPKIISISEQNNSISLEFVDGKKLSDYLDKLKNSDKICCQIGQSAAKLHDAGIIHGDLTTSNMIFLNNKVY